MVIDLQTLVLIIGIAHLMQVLVFFHQYKTNRDISGPGWWLAWSATECLAFALILLRGVPKLLSFVIIFQDAIILLGTFFVYVGVLRFFEKKVNVKILIPFFVSFVILHLFFFFVVDNITIRTLLLDISLSAVAFLTAISIYKNKTPTIASTAIFNSAIFIVHGSIFAFRSLMIISGFSISESNPQSLFNLSQYFDALLVGLLWTFGFIMMLNQRLNAEISEAKSHFEKIFNTSPDAATITRLSDGMFVDCNEGFSKITGYNKEDISGKSSGDINLWKNPDDRLAVVQMIKGKGFCENYELLFQLKSGEVITGLISAKAIMLNGIPHIISVVRDISERKQAEEAIQASEKKYRLLFQNLTTGFALHEIIVNADGQPCDYRFLEINPAFEIHTGLKGFDIIGKTILEVMPDFEYLWIEIYGKVAMTGIPVTFENYNIALNKHYQIHVYSPDPGKFATIFLDVTDQKQKETEISQKNEELQKLNAVKDKFFSIIAHDLRGPFGTFLSLTQIMAEDLPDLTMEELQKIAESMRSSSANLYHLLENLLEWAKIQQGLIPFNPKLMELYLVVDESLTMVMDSFLSKEIEMTCDIPDDLFVYADRYMLQTVIRNFASNAVKFTPRGGKIHFSAKPSNNDRRVEISIQDTGIGMSQTIVENLFRIDEQTNRKGTENEPSTGLGLMLCKEFVEKQGGEIRVESLVGKGSVFHFTLPFSAES